MTQFYLYPTSPIELDLMLDILDSEGVNKRIKTERVNLPFGYAESYAVVINCEYEKLEFIKYLVKKKQEQIEMLSRCPVREKNELVDEKQPYIKSFYIGQIPVLPYSFKELEADLKEKYKHKEEKTSILYRIWRKWLKKG